MLSRIQFDDHLLVDRQRDLFLRRQGTNGNSFAQLDFDWANKIKNEQGGNDFAQALTSDAAGNVLVTGVFSGTADLIYGAETALVSSNGGLDIYMAKFDTSGNLLWRKTMGGPLDDYTYSIKTDSNGDIYISGTCSENADFDGGDDTTLIQINGPSNSGIIFLSKVFLFGRFNMGKRNEQRQWFCTWKGY